MKHLTFDHQSVAAILAGKVATTWRLQDSNLGVGDVFELVDKRDAHDHTTWLPVGQARVETVIDRSLKQITDADVHEWNMGVSNAVELVELCRRYYGRRAAEDAVIKVIRFVLLNEAQNTTVKVDKYTTKNTELKLYTDGGSRGNPGPSAGGYVLTDLNDHVVVKNGTYLGVTTNNQAEYQALKLGLEDALHRRASRVHVYMDSLLVVNQMRGIYNIKNRDLWPIHSSIQALVSHFREVTFTHIPRTLNKSADGVVNQILDKHASAKQP